MSAHSVEFVDRLKVELAEMKALNAELLKAASDLMKELHPPETHSEQRLSEIIAKAEGRK